MSGWQVVRCIVRSSGVQYAATVASLGLVPPGAATQRVTPIFYWKKLTTFLVIIHRLLVPQCYPYV